MVNDHSGVNNDCNDVCVSNNHDYDDSNNDNDDDNMVMMTMMMMMIPVLILTNISINTNTITANQVTFLASRIILGSFPVGVGANNSS